MAENVHMGGGGGGASLLVQYFTLILAYSHLYYHLLCVGGGGAMPYDMLPIFLSWGMLLGRTNDQNVYP